MIDLDEDSYDDSCDFYVPTTAELAWFWFGAVVLTAVWGYCIILIFGWLWDVLK